MIETIIPNVTPRVVRDSIGEGQVSDLLTPNEVAPLLNVAPSTVRGWLKRGVLPGFQTPGGVWRIHRRDAERLRPPEIPQPEAAA
jgi:excisionase family DNA binding protein